MGIIYGLFEPDSDALRYIGKTAGTLKKRLREHLSRARAETHHCHNYSWLKSIGFAPGTDILEEVTGGKEELIAAERWWIEYMRSIGCQLTNHTDGGEGCEGYRHTPETRRRMSELQKGRKRGPRMDIRKTSLEQDRQICDRYLAGESCETVAYDFGLSHGGVRNILLRNSITLRKAIEGRWLTERSRAPIITPTEKVCSVCRTLKVLTEFALHNTCKYGRASVCRECHANKYYRPVGTTP